jgi:hypothetical protein
VSQSPEPTKEPNIFGKFASVVGLLVALLFFTGWIYRWSYFYFFQLDITTLELPAQSFLIVPFQIFLGDPWAISKTAIALIFASVAIHITLWLIHTISDALGDKLNRLRSRIISITDSKRSWIAQQLKSFAEFSSVQRDSIKVLRSLVDQIVIVVWLLVVLFWLARWQGIADARRAASQNSTLPVVALVTAKDGLALGRKLDDPLNDPPLKGYRIIGDIGLFDDLRGREDTDITNPDDPRVWRLLIERGGWIYLFQALRPNAKPEDRPLVLAIPKSASPEQMMILSPEVSKRK